MRAVPVSAAEVSLRDLSRTLRVSGRLEAVRTTSVASLGAGVVRSVEVEEGDRVKRGQLLATLDSSEHEAVLARATAARDGARIAYEPEKALRERGANTGHDYDRALAELEVAEAEVRLARVRIGFSRVLAPGEGVIVARHVEPGAAVPTGGPVVDIADDGILVVRLGVSDLDVPHIEIGQPARVTVDAFGGREVQGRVRRIFPAPDPSSHLVTLEVEVSVPDGETSGSHDEGPDAEAAPTPALRPGFLVRVSVVVDPRPSALAVPTGAVTTGSDGPWVYVIEDDMLSRRTIMAGVSRNGWTEVRSGLQAGERVVASGAAELAEGSRVRIAGWSG